LSQAWLAVALVCLLISIVGNTWELTYSHPRWPVLVIGVALFWVAMVLLMQIHANWKYRQLLKPRDLSPPNWTIFG
jgi:hypothetical protein